MWQGFAVHHFIAPDGTVYEAGDAVELENETYIQDGQVAKLIETGVLTDRDPNGGGSRKANTRAERGEDGD